MNANRKIFSCISVIILLGCFWFYKRGQPNKLPSISIAKLQTPICEPDKPQNIVSENKSNMGLIVSGGLSVDRKKRQLIEREKYSAFLKQHPFSNRTHSEEGENEPKQNTGTPPDLAWEQDFLRTMDPKLKRPTPEVLPDIIRKNHIAGNSAVKVNGVPGAVSTPWVERGPNNVGGRTRALVWDPNDVNLKKVWAGGVNGGLWYNNDITDANSSWNRADDFWANISVTSMVFDPNNPQIAYVGTGEGWVSRIGNGSGGTPGAGIWKTTNGGLSWTQLTSTTNFSYVNDLVVRNEAGVGVVYAAIDGLNNNGILLNPSNAGLQRSTNGGNTWSQVLPNVSGTSSNFTPASINIAANNRIWIGTKANPYNTSDKGGGYILYSDNGTTWNISDAVLVTNGWGRVTVACAPSDANYVYAFIEDNVRVKNIRRTTDGGVNWANVSTPVDADNDIPFSDFTRGQASYDQAIEVDPNNPNTVIIGGIDLFRTTNGGTSWSQISKWSNNNNLQFLTCSKVHADQHAIAFKPGSSSTVIFGNDGGVFYTTSISTAATNNVITARNKNYNVTQFYATAMHPTAGSNSYLAGAQDNGTQQFSTSGINFTIDVREGDGAYCFIDQVNPSYQIVSYVHNKYYLSTDGGISFPKTNTVISDANTGSFINPACYDNNQHILYTYKNTYSVSGDIYAIKSITSAPVVSTVNISGMKDAATAFKVSPYTTTSTTLFIGTLTGDLLKVVNANSNPTVTNIKGTLPIGSISCIEIGSSENELLVTFFNYGIKKIWYSQNGGTAWVDKSGNFPNIPARWALFNPNKRANEVILATELGIYATTNFSSASPIWTASNTGFANVRTDMLQLRDADYQVIAATHGRGLFSSGAFSEASAPTLTSFAPTSAATGASITITGTNFTNASIVSLGGTVASSFTVTSSTAITAIVGAGTSGNVSVTTPGGVATKSGFTFVLAPTITSFTPVNGGNGTIVTITGTNFTGATAVSFGGTAATIISVSDKSITAIVGLGASGSVSVTTPFGTATSSGFTFFAAPTITAFSPTASSAGATITITGTNFSNVLDVSFGGTSATAFTATSATNITAVIGGGSTGDVTVTTPGGTATKSGFTFIALPKPSISGFSPISGPVGTVVTINGSNFNTNPANYVVYFGAVRATVTAATATSLSVTVPVGATYQPISVLEKTTGLVGYTPKPFLVTFISKNSITTHDFEAKVDFTTSLNANGIALGDIDGDGKTDVVIANSDANTISIYRNISVSGIIANSSFAAQVDFATGNGPNNIAIADLDGDGKLDIAVSTINSTTVSVLRNTATPGTISTSSLATKVEFNIGFIGSRFVAISDLTSDGKADLAVVNGSKNTIAILRNTAAPGNITGSSFAGYVNLSTGIAPRGLAIGDIDGDSKPDLFVGNSDLSSKTVSIFKNTISSDIINSSSFGTKVDLVTDLNTPLSVAIGDLDGDGKEDLITVMYNSGNNVSIFRNIAPTSGIITTGAFASRVDLSTGQFPEPTCVAINDMDGDGKPDLVTSNGWGNSISIFRNTAIPGTLANASFLPNVDFSTGNTPYTFAIADMDGDGKPDIVALNTGTGTFSVFRNNPQYPPTITSFTPTSAATGATVTITGTNFANVNSVSFGGTTAAFTPVSATTLTAIIGSGSTGSVSVTNLGGTGTLSGFTFIPAPTITIFSPTSAATGAVVTITGANFTNVISVSFGGTTAAFTPVSATTIIAAVGVGSTGSVSVTTPGGTATKSGFIYCSPPTVTASGATTFCSGTTVILTSSSATGNQWYKDGIAINGAVNTTYSVTASGTYTDTASNTNGCKVGSSPIIITVNPLPPKPTVSAGSDTTFCSGRTVILTSSSATGNQWYKDGIAISGAVNTTYAATASGAYTDTVTNAGGCKAGSAKILITVFDLPAKPTITAGGPISLCSGGSVLLTSSSANNNQWYKDGVIISGATNISYTANSSGSYTDTVSNATGCKIGSSSIIITVNPLPAAPTVSAGSATTFCSGGTVILTSSSATGNQWHKDGVVIAGSINSTYTANATGTYNVQFTNANSCSATSASTSVTVNALPAMPTISAGGPSIFCDTGKVILTSSATIGNQWYTGNTAITGATNTTYAVNKTGNYTVVVTNSNNCTASSSATTVTVNAMPGKPGITLNNADLVSSSATGNQWYFDAAIIPAASAQNHRPSLSGYYKVQVTTVGCTGPFSDSYYYLVTGVFNIVGGNIGSYSIIPNPTTEKLLIRAANVNDKVSIMIIDASGRTIITREFFRSTTIDMSFLARGMYSLLLTDTKTKKQESKQIIKQ